MANVKKIILTGGGTGGHIAPLLAVAAEIKKINPNAEMLYLGRKEDVLSNFIRTADISSKAIYAGKLRRYFSWQNFIDFFKIAVGILQSLIIIWQFKPDVIFAKGGFVSVPVAFAARLFRRPIVAHESDVVMGLANRIISKWAKKIACGFEPKNYIDLPPINLVYAGNPVRPEFLTEKIKPLLKTITIGKRKTDPELPIVLIMGSSQGAHRINELSLSILPALLAKMTVIQISGRGDYNWLENESKRLLEKEQQRYFLYSFLSEELPAIIHKADVVVSRASAGVLSELALMEKPSIIIPLSTAAGNHQWHNAKIFQRSEAVELLDEREATPKDLEQKIFDLINSKKKRENLSTKISKFAKPDAAKKLAEIILEETN